jgi:eukaryotic-like serine/threonine-protein kinase
MSYFMSPGPRRRAFSSGQVVIIIIVVALVISGSVLLVYTSVTNNTAATNMRSTATAQANATHLAFDATNNAIVSSDVATAQVELTAQAQANMTATARAYVNATATASAQASATAIARAQAYASATAQAYASRDPYPPYSGTLVLSDPMSNNSQGHGWDVYALPMNNNCQFTGGAYESTEQSQSGSFYDVGNNCVAENTNFTNFTFQADVTIVKGGCGGITFRGNSKANNAYIFVVCAASTEITPAGYWALRVSSAGSYDGTIAEGSSPAIHATYGQTNILAVVAIGSNLTLYVNGQKLTNITSPTYTSGQIGLEASGEPGTLEVVMFSNVKVWTM